MSTDVTKVFLVTIHEKDNSPDNKDIANVAILEAQLLKDIGQLGGLMGMCQIIVTGIEEQGD